MGNGVNDELISRQAATTIPVMPKEHRHYQTNNLDDAYEQGWNDLQECIENLPPVQLGTDLVSKQAAIDAIHEDADWLAAQGSDWQVERMERDKSILKSLPPAQPTQEIIHCKDCRFWKKYKYFNGKPTYAPFCGFNSIFTDDNDFCSRAEKRGEAE